MVFTPGSLTASDSVIESAPDGRRMSQVRAVLPNGDILVGTRLYSPDGELLDRQGRPEGGFYLEDASTEAVDGVNADLTARYLERNWTSISKPVLLQIRQILVNEGLL